MSTDLLSATEVERYKQGAMFDIASGRMPRYPMLPERAGEIDGQDAYTGRQLSQVMGMLFWAMERYAEKQAARRAPVVPKEPTSKQVVLGAGALLGQPEHTADNRHPDWCSAVEKVRKVYMAMLAAAPQPPTE